MRCLTVLPLAFAFPVAALTALAALPAREAFA